MEPSSKTKTSKLKTILQDIKNLVFSILHTKKQKKVIQKQIDVDSKLVKKLRSKKIPSLRQLKYIKKVLSKKEKIIILIFILIIAGNIGYLTVNNLINQDVDNIQKDAEYVEGVIGYPQYINPLLSSANEVDADLCRLIFSGLMKYDKNLNIVPDLAKEYEVSEDLKEYTFKLRQNIYWHDNQTFTADDVAFTLSLIQDPLFQSPLYRSYRGIKYEVIDEHTIKMVLDEPYSGFLQSMTLGIIPAHLWQTTTPEKFLLEKWHLKPIGTGPYKFKSYKSKDALIVSYTLEKNDNYYIKDQIPLIKDMTFKFYPEYMSAINALKSRQILGLSYLPFELLDKINTNNYQVVPLSYPQYIAVFFNQKQNTLLKDKEIRKAILLAVNRNRILEEVINNYGEIIDSPVLPFFFPDINNETLGYDPAQAQEILAKKDYKIDEETGYLKKGDDFLEISLTTADQSEYEQILELIKEDLMNMGFKVETNLISPELVDQNVLKTRNYHGLIYGEILGSDPDPYPFWHSTQTEYPGLNLASFGNPNADKLLNEARQLNNWDERTEKYKEFHKIITEEIPAIFLYQNDYIYITSTDLINLNLEKIAVPADRFNSVTGWSLKAKTIFK